MGTRLLKGYEERPFGRPDLKPGTRKDFPCLRGAESSELLQQIHQMGAGIQKLAFLLFRKGLHDGLDLSC